MEVLSADKFEASGVAALEKIGCAVVSLADLTAETLADAVGEHDPDVLVVRSTKVQSPVFEAAGRLSLVVRAGAGVDNIDMQAASAKGINVANCPGQNSIAVAELAWGLILACDRRIPQQTAELRAGEWNKKEYSKARGLYGRTLGVVGVGSIGREVIKRGRAFGMKVVAWSRSLDDETAEALGVIRCATVLEVASRADVVSITIAANSETENLVDSAFCEALKPGAIFVNTSRGTVVDEAALLKAMREKGVRAGLDVYRNEPGASDRRFESELAREGAVCGTHHIGASTDQSQTAIATEAVRVIREYKLRGAAPNVVNLCEKSKATRLLSVRHLNKPGVLAHVVGEIGRAGINIEEMDNTIYHGAEAACALIQLDEEPSRETLAAIRKGSPHILSVNLKVLN